MKPELKGAKVISNRVLKSVWKKVSGKPLPDVLAYSLRDKEFLSTVKLLQSNKGVIDTRVKEYGVDFDNRLIEACTFEFEGHLIILVKQSVPLADTLEHELKHVAKWKHMDVHDKRAMAS